MGLEMVGSEVQPNEEMGRVKKTTTQRIVIKPALAGLAPTLTLEKEDLSKLNLEEQYLNES